MATRKSSSSTTTNTATTTTVRTTSSGLTYLFGRLCSSSSSSTTIGATSSITNRSYNSNHNYNDNNNNNNTILLVLVHAAGFAKEVWNPVLRRLRHQRIPASAIIDFVAMDVAGHGRSSRKIAAATPPRDWDVFLPRDITEAINDAEEKSSCPTKVGIGHSFGGTGIVLTELSMSSSSIFFDSMILFEPIIYPEHVPYGTRGKEEGDSGNGGSNPLVATTLKRQNRWPSQSEARRYFETRRAFARFPPESIRAVLDGTTQQRHPVEHDNNDSSSSSFSNQNHTAVELCCPPAVEAELYAGGWHNGKRGQCLSTIQSDVTVVAGERSVIPPFTVQHYQNRVAPAFVVSTTNATTNNNKTRDNATTTTTNRVVEFATIPNTGHFMVMEDPEACANIIAKRLLRLLEKKTTTARNHNNNDATRTTTFSQQQQPQHSKL